jgi:hypothetical protein
MRAVCVMTILAVLGAVSADGADRPVITFEKNQVVVSDATPGGRVACYGIAHDYVDLDRAVYRWGREALDDDLDGTVAIELPRDVPVRSIWACADVASGRFALAGPEHSPAKEIELRGRGALISARGTRQFQIEADRVDLVFFRHGEGAWLQLTGDGAANDDDRAADGAVHAAAEHFQGIGALKAVPATLEGAGTVIAFYPQTLEYCVVTLGEGE